MTCRAVFKEYIERQTLSKQEIDKRLDKFLAELAEQAKRLQGRRILRAA